MRRTTDQSGFSILEVLISLSILSLVMSGFLYALNGEVSRMQGMVSTSYHGLTARNLLVRVKGELEYGRLITPEAFLAEDLGGGTTNGLRVNSTLGFPDQGRLLLGPGEAREERIGYERLSADGMELLDLERGQACTSGAGHARGSVARWAGTASFIENQSTPGASEFDGVSQELFGPRFYRGDGTGVVFQSSIASAPGESRFDGTDVRWGATVDAQAITGACSTLRFAPVATVTEADRDFDFNGDGDRSDSFELGSIHLRSWNPAVPGDVTDTALCPPIVLQETCQPAADLDADGFQDPIFLIDPRTGWVRVRLFVLAGAIQQTPVVQRLEMALHVRNINQS